MRTAIVVAVVLLVATIPVAVLAADNNVLCDKRAKGSEFSWNPDNKDVTPQLSRFYLLGDEVKAAYESGDDGQLTTRVQEYLQLAATYRCNWNYGNAIHDANRYMGLASVRKGNLDEAARYLLLSGKSTGSPQLDSFGPELDLADELLKRGKSDAVTQYLRDIKRFWKMDSGEVDEWLAAIATGKRPELDRFASMQPSPWLIASWWLVTGVPAILVLSLAYALKNPMRTKLLFILVGAFAGYATLILLNLGLSALLVWLVSTTASMGRLGVFLIFGLPLIMAIAMPALIVFGVFRYFSAHNELPAEPG